MFLSDQDKSIMQSGSGLEPSFKFLHKGTGDINLPQLIRSQFVMDKIPAYFNDKEPPIISYQYTNAVSNKLFNFSSTLSNLDITNYLSNPQHCRCNTSKFCYEPHGHIITIKSMVIENVKFRKLVAKGLSTENPIRSTGSQQKLWFQTPLISMWSSGPNRNR